MLADQFTTAVASVRTLAQLEEISRLLWRAHGEREIADAAAEAISEAVEARRARIKGAAKAPTPADAAHGPP